MGQHDDDARLRERSGPQVDAAAAATLVKGTERRGEVDYEVECPTCHGKVRVTEYPGGPTALTQRPTFAPISRNLSGQLPQRQRSGGCRWSCGLRLSTPGRNRRDHRLRHGLGRAPKTGHSGMTPDDIRAQSAERARRQSAE